MFSTGLIGPFFFCGAFSNMTNVTEENYLKILQEFAVSQLQPRSDLANVFFKLDGTPHLFAR